MSTITFKRSWYNVGLLSAGHFFNDFYVNFLPVLLPIIIPSLGLSLTMSGLLIMILSFTSNVMQPVFGYFIDRKNLNSLLLYAVPGGAIFTCALGLIDSKALLFFFVGISGFAVSSFHPLGSSLIHKTAPENRLGQALSYFVAGGNIGYACAPLVLVFFLDSFGMHAMPYLIIPTLLLAAATYHAGLTKSSEHDSTAAAKEVSIKSLLCQKNLLKLNVAMGMRAWTYSALTMFIPMLLVSLGHSNVFSGVMLTIFLVGASIGSLIGGYANDKIGYKKVIIFSLALGIIPTYIFFSTTEINVLTLTALFICGASLQAASPSSLVWAQKMLPNNAGIASGMMLGLAFGIGGVGTALTGALGDIIGLSTAMLLMIVPLFIGIIVTMTIPEK